MAVAGMSFFFAACSNDEMDNTAGAITPDMETSYAQVRISMSGLPGTRADSDFDGFDDGTPQEAKINNLTLLLYAGDDLVGVGTSESFTTPTRPNTNPNQSVSDSYKSSIVKISLFPGKAMPTKLEAYVNTYAENENPINIPVEKVSSIGSLSKGFVMSNAGYYKGNNWTISTTIDPAKTIFNNEADAKAASNDGIIDIYVERLAAKVKVNKKESDFNCYADVVIKDKEGNEYKILFEPKKWNVTGTAREMYMMKQAFDKNLTWANDDPNYRSYWAEGVNYTTSFADYNGSSSPLVYVSANKMLSKTAGIGNDFNAVEYTMEHTYGNNAKNGDAFDPVMTSTCAIIVGKYAVKTADGQDAAKFKVENSDNYQYYLSMSGSEGGKTFYTIYNEAEMIQLLLDRSNIMLSASEDGNNQVVDLKANFTVKTSKADKTVSLVLKGTPTLYYKEIVAQDATTNNWQPLTQDALKGMAYARNYLNGWAYYFVPIEHHPLSTGEIGTYGVVRNHSYVLTINSITGVGAPLDDLLNGGNPEGTTPKDPDPDDPDSPVDPGDNPIKPDPDDLKDAYINATLQVLSWHNAVNQDVDP